MFLIDRFLDLEKNLDPKKAQEGQEWEIFALLLIAEEANLMGLFPEISPTQLIKKFD
jgi:hypothetical protein